MKHLVILLTKLSLLLAVSSMPRAGAAHEVLPAIADISARGDVLSIEIRLNLEAQLSGINLDRFANTDDAENFGKYNILRAEPNVEIAARAGQMLQRWNSVPLVRAGAAGIALRLEQSVTEDVRNVELPRLTTIRMTGNLPEGAESVVFSWPAGSGPMVLRHIGVEEGYTGFLVNGAETPDIDLRGGG